MYWLDNEVDICIVPSRVDNYPYVVMEASRAGCYVIASDAGGIPEIFEDYKVTGALFPPKDYRALGQEIQKAIHHIRDNPGIRTGIAEEFEKSRQNQIQRTLATYDSMVEKGKKYISPSLIEKAKPRVSIIIPFYNSHQYAGDAIRSAFASDYPDFEVILVNDGSDDPKSHEFLKGIEREFPHMKIIHKSNGGLGDARNAGLKVASGEFIVPLDSDNMILQNLLSSCVRVLTERDNLSYVTTYFECLREKDGARVPWQLSPIPRPLGAVDGLILLEPTPGDALAMIRRSALESVGGYTTTIYCMGDWDLWLKFYEKGMEGDVIPEVHFIYRLRSNSMSRSLDAQSGVRLQQSLLQMHQDLVKEHSNLITTLLLEEYWSRWVGPDKERMALIDISRHAINDPKPAFRCLANKFWLKIEKSMSSSPVIRKLARAIKLI